MLAQTAASSLVDMPCSQNAVLRNNLVFSIQHSMWMHVNACDVRTPSHIIQSMNSNLFEKVLDDSTCLPLCLQRIPLDFYNILVTCMACNSRRSARFISERSLTTSHMQHAIAALWVSWSRWMLRWKNLLWQRKSFYPALLVHARDESPRFLPWICSSHFTWPFWFGLSISRH